MKTGGHSWNYSLNKKQGIQARHVCKVCGRQYKIEWAKANHEILCREREKKLNKN